MKVYHDIRKDNKDKDQCNIIKMEMVDGKATEASKSTGKREAQTVKEAPEAKDAEDWN